VRRLLLLCGVLACSDHFKDPDPCIGQGGTGIDPDTCLLPWPSSHFLVADPTTATGYRIQLPQSLMPVNMQGVAVDASAWNSADGFSPMTTMLAELPAVVNPSMLPTWQDPSPSLLASSQTIILDTDANQLVANFAEVEASDEVAPGTTELYIRPAARLAENHHFVVAIQNLVDTDGLGVSAPEIFANLRDSVPTELPERTVLAYEENVFAPLVAAGIARSTLQLAWDFRTASGTMSSKDLLAMRDAAFAMTGLGCTFGAATQIGSGVMQYTGTFTVPSFLDGSNRIARDASGNPMVVGTVEAPWLAIVPPAATTSGSAAPFWLYGHGLFSDHTELARDFGQDTTQLAGAVAVATDYTGLTMADEGSALEAFLDLSTFPTVIDRLRQGVVNTLLLPQQFATACVALPELSAVPALQQTDWAYFGNSMGGTMGQTIAALSPDIHRYAIGVGGMDFSVMMPRTHEWVDIENFYDTAYKYRVIRDLLLLMSQTTWDLAESSTFGPHVLTDPLEGGSAATLLLQTGLEDCDTTNIASAIAERTMGLPALDPSAPQPNAFVMYDLGAAALPDNTLPPPVEDGVHECVRRDPRAQQQIAAFLPAGGSIINTCGSGCVPLATTPACLMTYAGP
jgi:hypothetical protein